MAAPAFAQSVSSNAGVQANQSTDSGALVGPRTGSVIVGSVAGNYVDVTSTASAQDAGRVRPATTKTNVTVDQRWWRSERWQDDRPQRDRLHRRRPEHGGDRQRARSRALNTTGGGASRPLLSPSRRLQ